ncbi:hypothetical protein CDAR_414471 [Caerostris darwini]|uniref:Antistasin-like domain-containing protein n=1 Tax=Caerostris darwini TaxID=1538125 RepID=A0AAV4RFI0_9ARAC|nr:hypothetical protein CDAR_414471 [Caerostris darwini]
MMFMTIFLVGVVFQFSAAGQIRCTTPDCPASCYLDYELGPCPVCVCDDEDGSEPSDDLVMPAIQCTIPMCDPPCRIDYSARPCPSCECYPPSMIQCSMPKCDPPCGINYSTAPCPSCECPEDETMNQAEYEEIVHY